MPNIRYHTLNGRITSTTAPNVVRTAMLPDALGSVVRTINEAGGGRTTRFAGYGSQLYTSGAWDLPRNAWVGSLGYRSTQMRHAEQYVRARHYSSTEGTWATVDPLWPDQKAYGYVMANPLKWVDPKGLMLLPPLFPPKPRRQKPWIKLPPAEFSLPLNPMNFSYGQYCGSATIKNPGWRVEPQDCIDACCLVHDRCLEAHYGAGISGIVGHSCCDKELSNCVRDARKRLCCANSPLPFDCALAANSIERSMDLLDASNPWPTGPGCLPPNKWPRLYKGHWGNPRTCVPIGKGA